MKVKLLMYLNQSMVRLHQIYRKSLVKGLSWIIDSFLDHTINISKHNDSCYIKLPKELDHPKNV